MTKTIKIVGYNKLGTGQNAVVAVMSFSGYDIEDAIVMNRSSVDRGFGRSIIMNIYTVTTKKYVNQNSERTVEPLKIITDECVLHKINRLDSDGIVYPGNLLQPKDTIVNKNSTYKSNRSNIEGPNLLGKKNNSFHRHSFIVWKGKHKEFNTVDRVILTTDRFEKLVIKVLIRHTRKPEHGDKFSSRHGQKGVLGNIILQEDMPFSEFGINPDLIMNPHGFPSRMTVGKMFELIGSKAASLSGKYFDGTAFGESIDNFDLVNLTCEILTKKGFAYSGKDFMMSGINGEPIGAYIFMGSVYYQRLKHMVADKMHSRAVGPRILLTRQPTEGRAREGGLRFGEMERDCLISFGAAMLLIERLLLSSDKTDTFVCTNCKILSYWQKDLCHSLCPSCKMENTVVGVQLPYCCKLLFQELKAMNISIKILTSN